LVLPALAPAQRRRRIVFKEFVGVSLVLHAGVLLAFVGWLERTVVGAIQQPTAAVSVEMIESRTLEAFQKRQIAEPVPSPEATAPAAGRSEASDAHAAKVDPSPKPEVVEPPPISLPDAIEEKSRAAKPNALPQMEEPPALVESPTPTEAMPERQQAKVAEDKPPAKARQRSKLEKKAANPAPKGGTTSKSKAGKGTGSGRASASRGSILTYAALVRARVAANKPSGSGLRGTAVVAFGVTPSGDLRYARVVRSSGNAALDRLALAAVRRSAPFPTPPAGAASTQLRFSIPFDFQ
jgi:protein TonB